MESTPPPIAVEYNREILHRQYGENTEMKEGDRLEIVTIVGRGSGEIEITIPQAWLAQYQILAQQKGIPVTDLLQKALGQYISSSDNLALPSVKVVVIPEDEEEEDEADEILTDFLPR